MDAQTRIQVIIPFHQPLYTQPEDVAEAVERCYDPLLKGFESRDGLRATFHFGGHLLDYLAREREDFLMRVRELVLAKRVEVLGGFFYGGIPALLPEDDASGQLQMSSEFWGSYLGGSPTGFWLPELAWSVDLPRLMSDSGFEYGFVADSQIREIPPQGLGMVERGGSRVVAFILDGLLSQRLPTTTADEWVDAVIDRAGRGSGRHCVCSVWVRAESLGWEAGTHDWCHRDGWLDQWLDALAGGRSEIMATLPAESFQSGVTAAPIHVEEACATAIGAYGLAGGSMRWDGFPRDFVELDTLYRRAMRVSDRLREAISSMEEEELEEDWSDSLATAQRLIFAAQSPEAYFRGHQPGFGDPRVRDAVTRRLIEATELIDALVQGDEDWIGTEEEDRDGDLRDEIFVGTAHLSAWWVVERGGELRSLDVTRLASNVLDVGTRRDEPFFPAVRDAPRLRAEDVTLGMRGEGLGRLADDLPMTVDGMPRRGMRIWILEENTSAEEFFQGFAVDLMPSSVAWRVLENGIDEEGDANFRGVVEADVELAGLERRRLAVSSTLDVPIDAPMVRVRYRASLQGGPNIRLAVEIPIRLGSSDLSLSIDGSSAQGPLAESVRTVEARAADGARLRIEGEREFDLWWTKVDKTIKTLAGYDSVHEGVVVVPSMRVEGDGELSFTISILKS